MTKNQILLIVAAVVILATMYFSCQYGKNSITKTVGSDTVLITHTDTVQGNPILVRDTVEKTKWYKVTDHDTLEVAADIPITDTLTELVRLQAVERKYNKRNIYIDTPRGKNWKVDATLTVQQNELKATNYVTTVIDSSIHTTTLLEEKQQPVISLVGSHMANLNNPFFASGGGIKVDLPNGTSYQAQYFNVTDHRPMVMVTVGTAIRNLIPHKKRKP